MSAGPRAPAIHLVVDRVVLRGVAPEQREALIQALQDEIRARLASSGELDSLGSSRSQAGVQRTVDVAGPSDAATLGATFAQGLHAELTR